MNRRVTFLTLLLVALLQTTQSFSVTLTYPTSRPATVLHADETYVRCGKCDTSYLLSPEQLGDGRGRRLSCTVCGHSWFQSKDRISTVHDSHELVELPERDVQRIQDNLKNNRSPKYMGAMKLYVGNVSYDCHEEDFFMLFQKVGPVGEVVLVRDDEGKNRGFGFVTMVNKEDGQKSMEELDGSSVRGRRINVREATN